VWRGANVGGDVNLAVPEGTREVPMLFGAGSPVALERMARWGQGYIAPSVPAAMAAQPFDAARAAWQQAGRDGTPRLVGLVYFTLGDTELGRKNVYDYYSVSPDFVDVVLSGVADTPQKVKDAITQYQDLGADDVILNPGTDDPADIARLAEIVL
jgi:alkanesulfonate monooxygenase SsuD/methylene tetrahydromethanopterin reductase-like flavin-dependent oxidoreductase (luciferase family)